MKPTSAPAPVPHSGARARAAMTAILEARGAGIQVLDAAQPAPILNGDGPGVLRIGLHRADTLPTEGLDAFDILLSRAAEAPRPWVTVNDLERTVEALAQSVQRNPVAAAVLAQVLRASLELSFDNALAVESAAYSMLLASAEFARWRDTLNAAPTADPETARVAMFREDNTLHIRLARPGALNAVDARLRDELHEALRFAVDDPEQPDVLLSAEGRAFSIGGDLAEFGSFGDAGQAHLIRCLRSPAALIHRIRERVTARLHGACIGSGIEIPAAAGRLIAAPNTFFQLPEVSMGVIPGAGGTVTLPRRIGAQRCCYLALSGRRLSARTALQWGLVDAIEEPHSRAQQSPLAASNQSRR